MVARRAHNPEVVRFKSHLRNQKESNPFGLLFFLRFGLGFEHSLPPPTESVGGSGLGARALAVRDEARATREKIRSIGWALPRTHPRRLYFRVGLSNPTSATKKDSIVDTISAMEFCFIYGKRLVFALKPLFSVVLRAFFSYINDKSAILCPGKTEVADFVSFKGSIVQ